MRFLLLVLLLVVPWLSFAQLPLQVVNRIIEKTMPYRMGQPIEINAQKADVVLKGWDRPTVSVQLKLQAKHADRLVAEREVAYHLYTLSNEKGVITLANRFIIPQRAGKLQSQLKALYEINLPHEALVRLTNSFGDIQVRDLAGEVSISLEYGKLTIADMKGKILIQTAYGDIEGHNLNAMLTIKTEKTDILLDELGGITELQSQYGRLSLAPVTTLRRLDIEAQRADLLIMTKRLSDFHYEITTTNASILVPETVLQHLLKAGHKQSFIYHPGPHKGEITIKNSYSSVTLQGEKPFVTK